MDLDGDGVLLGVTEVDSQVAEVLGELAYKPPVLEICFAFLMEVVESAVQEFRLEERLAADGVSYLGDPRQ